MFAPALSFERTRKLAIGTRLLQIHPDQIEVLRDTRQRREIDTKGLVESIKLRGIMNPLIVQAQTGTGLPWVLIAGERRLAAARELGLHWVPCRDWAELGPIEAQIVELEENLKRQDLSWQEQVQAVARIHELYMQENPAQTMQSTADSLGTTVSWISKQLRIWRDWADEKIQKAGTAQEAYNLLVRRDARVAEGKAQEIMDALDDEEPEAPRSAGPGPEPAGAKPVAPGSKLYIPATVADPAKSILHESFLQWAPRYTGGKFNLIHCDFPYGLDGLFDGKQMQTGEHSYADSPELYTRLLECLCKHMDRFVSQSAHLLFWYSEKQIELTRRMFKDLAPSWVFQPFPLIWVKSDNSGIAAHVNQSPRHVYETCLMATRGRRPIVRVVADAYSAPRDGRLHVSAKPVSVLKHFMTMLVDETTLLLDPTCGSGNALQAVEALGGKHALGLEIDETMCGLARQALRTSRSLRSVVA